MKRPQDLGEPGCTANDPLVFAAAFNSGDPAAVEQLYEDLGILVPEPGQPVSGRDRAAANTALLELGLPIEVRPRHIYTVDDIALLIVDWSVTGTPAATAHRSTSPGPPPTSPPRLGWNLALHHRQSLRHGLISPSLPASEALRQPNVLRRQRPARTR
jgi:hypothetical protein